MENDLSPSSSSTGRSSPVALPSSYVIYIICGGYGPGVACEIYGIDISHITKGDDQTTEGVRSSAPLPKPVCSFTNEEVPFLMGYFMVGDCIYMIGGERIVPLVSGSETVNEVFTFNTKTSQLSSLSPMHCPKSNAIVIGPSKTGGHSYYYTIGRRLSYHDFELFMVNDDETSSGQWTKLPQPPVPCFPKRYRSSIETEVYAITGYTIVDKEQFILISTKSAGVFAYYINKRLWTCIDASAVLPFCFGATFVPSTGLYFGFSPTSNCKTGIVGLSAVRGLDLVLRKLLSGKFRQFYSCLPVHSLDPLFEEPIFSGTLIFLNPLSNGRICFVRSCSDESSLDTSDHPRMLVAINVFHPQVMDSDGTINAVDTFSMGYLLDESSGLKNICACLLP